MSRTPLIPTIIATGLGSGFAPKAPGTAGAILATIMWFATSYLLEPTTLDLAVGLRQKHQEQQVQYLQASCGLQPLTY